jgi:hypothetical protein
MNARTTSNAALTAGLVLLVLGILGGLFATMSMVISTFGDVAHMPAAERQTMLSDGLRAALMWGLGVGGATAVVGGMLTAFGLQTRRSARAAP